MLEQRMSVITIGVADIKRSRAFYEKLGWKSSHKSTEEVVFFQLNGLILAIWGQEELAQDAGLQMKAGTQFKGVALAYNVRTKEEVAAILDLAQKLGGRITRKAQGVSWGGHTGYFTDPDGHLWEIAYNPFWPLDEKGNIRIGDE